MLEEAKLVAAKADPDVVAAKSWWETTLFPSMNKIKMTFMKQQAGACFIESDTSRKKLKVVNKIIIFRTKAIKSILDQVKVRK